MKAFSKCVFILLITMLGITPALAQNTDERIELRLRLRYPDGQPVVGKEVGLIRVHDMADMGYRTTDNNGEAVWFVEPYLMFQFELDAELSETMQDVVGEQGISSLGVYTGWAGEINADTDMSQPIIVGIVISDESGENVGNLMHLDKTPEEDMPSPSIPGVTSPELEHPAFESQQEDAADDESIPLILPVFESSEAEIEATAPPETASSESNAATYAWLILFMLAGLVVVAGYLWLRPALRGVS